MLRRKADLNHYESLGSSLHSVTEATLPDLHGNALKLLKSLACTGFISISKEDYNNIANIYYNKKSNRTFPFFDNFLGFFENMWGVKPITQSIKSGWDLKSMEKSMESIQVLKPGKKYTFRLIGDELADRGNNDYYTLMLMDQLKKKGLVFETIVSNHGFEFIQGYEKKDFTPKNISFGCSRSLVAMKSLIDDGWVTVSKVINMINTSYKPTLKLLSYSISKDQKKIYVYSHAPTDLWRIEKLAQNMDVAYADSTALKLAQTIDTINAVFQKKYVQKNKVHDLWIKIGDFIWNRVPPKLPKPRYQLHFVHGHASRQPIQERVHNLDYNNDLGKGPQSEGELKAFIIQK